MAAIDILVVNFGASCGLVWGVDDDADKLDISFNSLADEFESSFGEVFEN